MPEVPSSRACDACRAQRKRCDQKQPACDRCVRLRIQCHGSGAPRYKFKEYKVAPLPAIETGQDQGVMVICRSPSNEITRLSSSLVEQIGVDDPRYNLILACGQFLEDIPRRLGCNSTLDAAVDVFTASVPYVLTRRQSPQMFRKYGIALRELRTILGNPATSRTASTLCAIYLIWICEAWISKAGDEQPNHGEALGQLLDSRPLQAGVAFDERVLGTIVPALLVESILNPGFQIPHWLKQWCEHIKSTMEENMPVDEQSWAWVLGVALRLPDLIRFDPEVLHEAKAMYHARVPEPGYLRRHLLTAMTVLDNSSADGAAQAQEPALNSAGEWHARRLCLYGLGLAMSAVLNTILRAYDPEDVDLAIESAHLVREIITMAKQASMYRPLGAAYVNFCLMSARTACANTDLSIHAEVETVLADYQLDFLGLWLTDGCRKMMTAIHQLRAKVTRWQRNRSATPNNGRFAVTNCPANTIIGDSIEDPSTTQEGFSVHESPGWSPLRADLRQESIWKSDLSREELDSASTAHLVPQFTCVVPSLGFTVCRPQGSNLQGCVRLPSPFPSSHTCTPLFVGTLAAFASI
ncbi:hypothetical protein RBB50_012769 [Rhinocladiella similis]